VVTRSREELREGLHQRASSQLSTQQSVSLRIGSYIAGHSIDAFWILFGPLS
jgi:hypothetical protein